MGFSVSVSLQESKKVEFEVFFTHKARMKSHILKILEYCWRMHFLTEGSRQHCWKLLPAGRPLEQNIFIDCWLGWWRCHRVLESFAVKYLHMLHFLAADTVGIKRKWKLKLCLLTSRNLSFDKVSHWLLIRLLRAGLLYSLPWCFLNETKTNIAAETLRVRSRRPPSGCMSHFKIGARAANRPLEEHTWGRAAAPTVALCR